MTSLTRQPDESLGEFLRRVKAEQEAPKPESAPTWDSDLIPDVPRNPNSSFEKERHEIDAVLDRIGIVEAYNRWCGKTVPKGQGPDGIKVGCPNPQHADDDPSAWLHSGTNLWTCPFCPSNNPGKQAGGDKYDIAAWHFGFDVPGYKDGENFPALRRRMAEDLGYTVMVQGKDEWLERTQPTASPEPNRSSDSTDQTSAQTSAQPDSQFEWPDFVQPETPGFDWHELELDPDSFLYSWLETTSMSYEPEEFYFWEGLMALGNAVGNYVTLDDTIPVRPNMLVCLIGMTGTGKSIAVSLLERLVREALPWDASTAGGVRLVSSPGSGEALIDQFAYSVTDPNTGTRSNMPVNGLYRESELAAFVKRTGRSGNTMREIVMDFFDRSLPVASTSRGAGTVIATDHYMSMLTSTQPDSISRLLSDADAGAGFLNRWVFAFGTPKVRPPRNAVRVDVSPCVTLLRQVRSWAGTGRSVRFLDNTPAAEEWDQFYLAEIHPLTMNEDARMAARLPLLAKKIVLCLAINDHSDVIELEHIKGLKALWPYLLKSYGLVSDEVGKDDLEDCATRIEQYMSAHPGTPITCRQLKKQSGARHFKTDVIVKALELLCKASFIEEVPRAKGDKVARYRYS